MTISRGFTLKIDPKGCNLEQIELEAIVQALGYSNWVQCDAAEILGISPRALNYYIKTRNLDLNVLRVEWPEKLRELQAAEPEPQQTDPPQEDSLIIEESTEPSE
jgi:hypothetical protein